MININYYDYTIILQIMKNNCPSGSYMCFIFSLHIFHYQLIRSFARVPLYSWRWNKWATRVKTHIRTLTNSILLLNRSSRSYRRSCCYCYYFNCLIYCWLVVSFGCRPGTLLRIGTTRLRTSSSHCYHSHLLQIDH